MALLKVHWHLHVFSLIGNALNCTASKSPLRMQGISRTDRPINSSLPAALSFLYARAFQGQGSLTGYSPWDSKELDTTERLSLFHFWRDTIQPITLGGIIPNNMKSEYPPPLKDQEEGKDVCCHYCFVIEVEVLASAVRRQK